MEWLMAVKEQAQSIHDIIEDFVQRFPIDEEMDQQVLDILLPHAVPIYNWIIDLPTDEALLALMPWYFLSHSLNNKLSIVSSALFTLTALMEDKAHFSAEQRRLKGIFDITVNHQRTLLSQQLNPFFVDYSSSSAPIYTQPPHIAVLTAWHYYDLYLFAPAGFMSSLVLPVLPSVTYSVHLLHYIVAQFTRLAHRVWQAHGRLHILIQEEDQHAALYLTNTALELTPTRWQDFARHFHANDPHERLYEDRCLLDPVVWDEGYGQGIVVRLPWARG